MAHVILEQSFEKPLTDEEWGKFAKRLDPCLEVRRGAWVRSYIAADRKRVICEFEAPDAESVREALHAAEVPFDRVWSGQLFSAEQYPDALEKLRALRPV